MTPITNLTDSSPDLYFGSISVDLTGDELRCFRAIRLHITEMNLKAISISTELIVSIAEALRNRNRGTTRCLVRAGKESLRLRCACVLGLAGHV